MTGACSISLLRDAAPLALKRTASECCFWLSPLFFLTSNNPCQNSMSSLFEKCANCNTKTSGTLLFCSAPCRSTTLYGSRGNTGPYQQPNASDLIFNLEFDTSHDPSSAQPSPSPKVAPTTESRVSARGEWQDSKHEQLKQYSRISSTTLATWSLHKIKPRLPCVRVSRVSMSRKLDHVQSMRLLLHWFDHWTNYLCKSVRIPVNTKSAI